MWNQASASIPAAAMGGGSGNPNSSMAHTTAGPFASHARSTSIANGPPTHRRTTGGVGPAQHASSPSSNPIFPRPFPNAAFPGTVSAPRSAAAPNTALATPRSIQHLSLLTTETPTSIARLAFPPHTAIYWHRLQKNSDAPATTTGHDHQRQDAATSSTAASASSSPSWHTGVQRVLSSANKSRSQPRAPEEVHGQDHAALQRLLKVPLVYASSKVSPSESLASSTSKAELWIFAVVTDQDGLSDNATSASIIEATDTGAAHASNRDADASQDAAAAARGDSTPLDPTLARHLPADLVKSLSRLSTSAHASSGSYRLSAAATNSIDGKGKQSSLTSQQRKAHKRFMASIKARFIDSLASGQPTSPKQKRDRLRLGDSVVFLPSRSSGLSSTATNDAGWFAAPGRPKTSLGGVSDSRCLLTQLAVSLTATSLYVRATSRPLAALPLINTRFASISTPLPPSPARPTLLIAPLGCHVELAGMVPTTLVAQEHLSELGSAFAGFGTAPNDPSPFASGVAICAFPQSPSGLQSHQDQPHLQDPQQLPEASLVPSAQGEASDQDMPLAAPSSAGIDRESANATGQGSLQFLWPAAWCLVVQDRATASTGALGLGSNATNDLKSMQSQPMTPLKELVSFTLKMLNDANESALAQGTAPYTPGEPDDASLARHRASTRADITPASLSFADFDFAMPTAGSATSSHALPAAGQSVPPGTASPLKRESTSIEPAQAANSTEAFGQDLNWMQFLPPQGSEAPASSSEPAFAMQIDATSAGSILNATAKVTDEAKHSHIDPTSTNWLLSGNSSSVPESGATAAAHAPNTAASQSLLQPLPQMQSHESTPFQGQHATTPLGFAQPTSSKRKAGEGDIFGNLGLLTEDDFSFFDESAFGLDAEGDLAQHMDQTAEGVSMGPSQHHLTFDQPQAGANHATAPNMSMANEAQPASSTAPAVIDDVAMEDVGQSSLDALFSAIPGLQDAMASSESSHPQSAPLQTSLSTSATAVSQLAPPRLGHSAAQDMTVANAGSTHAFHPAMSSFTPRDASGATPFGDPASLPGFTPSSLTESSPAFGNPHYKTPRTPYSPAEEFRDGATIVDLHNGHRMGESAQGYRDRNAASAPDLHASDQHPLSGHKADTLLHDDQQLRLADASTAAAAAANAAMETDASSRKRTAIVPNAFLPLRPPEARKPLQRLPAGARANLGRKYDLLGKFAPRPKTATATATATAAAMNASNAPTTTEHPSSGDAGKVAERTDGQNVPESGRQGNLPAVTRPSPAKTPSHRGQALLQLRRDRHGKSSPGLALTNLGRSSSSRAAEGPATPRSSDDVILAGAMSASDGDTSDSADDDSDDALSDSEATALTLSPQDQATLKDVSLDVVASYLCGASHVFRTHWPAASSAAVDQTNENASTLGPLIMPPLPLSRAVATASIVGTAAASSSPPRPTLRRWMLSRTAAWLIQNPQFRCMYGMRGASSTPGSELAIGDKIDVLEAMASALSIAAAPAPTNEAAETRTAAANTEAEAAVPTLRDLVRPSKHVAGVAGVAADGVEVAEVLEPTRIAAGCQGSVVEALPSSLTLWDKSKLSAVSGQKHIVAKVLLTDASPAWHEEIVAWLERLRVAFETHGLGTHVGDAQSILAVADGSESLALSSCLDRLWQDGETWLDTLRSISSRVEVDLLQGKHVVVYTLQPPNSSACASTGFRGLLRLEADLRAMLSEQVGVLAEQLLVRAVSPSMMTESGSLGFGQQSQTLRRLAFSVYDQLPRLVRRQPAKVLHGREAGPISAVVQFPAFSLSTVSASGASKTGRTNLSLGWPQEPAAALDEHVLLHISYRVCQTGPREQAEQDSNASLVATRVFGLSGLADGGQVASTTTTPRERIVLVSAIDERGGSSTVEALAANDGDSSIEACVERVWRFALAEASRARVRWRLAVSSAEVMSQRELAAWQRMIGSYTATTEAEERVMGSVELLSVRPDEAGAVVAERGGRTKPSQPWAATADKSSLVLLDAADFSQMVRFAEPMPMGWTQAVAEEEEAADDDDEEDKEGDEKDALALPIASAMLVHRSRPDLLSSTANKMHRLDGGASASQVLAVDMLYRWTGSGTEQQQQQHEEAQDEAAQEEAMDAILRSLHRLRLLSEERHQLAWPYTAQPWSVASVNTLAACLEGIVLDD
ncbi:conserved hypothetical protein [Sporisorium reilianum SRZ2]|uniref:Mediator of RNA polymerase II transcription subunit 13 n=1 Tax=Sporisorium reilianum (strain SRZ2) TaxID=999809 RepID=E6ZWB5_SPORE|nr:conserved hypothetical protein [Sporisorium reilianum SRZ2]